MILSSREYIIVTKIGKDGFYNATAVTSVSVGGVSLLRVIDTNAFALTKALKYVPTIIMMTFILILLMNILSKKQAHSPSSLKRKRSTD